MALHPVIDMDLDLVRNYRLRELSVITSPFSIGLDYIRLMLNLQSSLIISELSCKLFTCMYACCLCRYNAGEWHDGDQQASLLIVDKTPGCEMTA